MHILHAGTLINARSSTVWDIITDAGNYTVWDSGITAIDGEVRNGGTIRIRTTADNRRYRLHVEQVPGEFMTWTRGLPLGLFKSVRTFTISSQAAMTHLRVTEESCGPLAGLIGNTVQDADHSFADYVRAVKRRAELIG
ncbi:MULTISPECIES: SRPBCC family protein [Micrococcaceae]|uniref:SRPBCC family protein n=1 Tax=Micrococcaceae TaxID=1268 RepID=UPI001AE8E5ED|nr:SRPBCC family protein [Arthrobacter sp. PvP023]